MLRKLIDRLANKLIRRFYCKMEEGAEKFQFTQKTNPTTGKFEWVAENQDEHDYVTDIARSSYADMLHDHERNKLYHKAIKIAIESMHKRGKKAKVLDIGTGTGLLSMMAASVGADVITAIEVFTPMAEIARKVTKQNGFSNIEIINKHSTQVTLGENGDMKEKANIIITELFDTELIGEGALSAYQHAHKYLMEENCIAVPHRAITYAVIVESATMLSWHEMQRIGIHLANEKSVDILPNPEMCRGSGVHAVHDIQLSQFPVDKFTEITKPIEVFDFKWGDKNISDKSRSNILQVKAVSSGNAQVVLSWWDLEMDEEGSIILSTAPHGYHPTPQHMQWRDHWIQSVYFLPRQFQCDKGDLVTLKAGHDDYSLWFEAALEGQAKVTNEVARPTCDYPPRMVWSRPRLGMVNDLERNEAFSRSLNNVEVPADGLALCVSDFSLLSLFVAQTCFVGREVIALEQSKIAHRGLINLVKHNHLKIDVICGNPTSISTDLEGQKISLFAGEPFFSSSYLPWHDLYFWYARSELDSYLHSNCQIYPRAAHLCMAAVQFEDLWKIRAPVGNVEGFDVSAMDVMIEQAMEMKEYHEPEPHALWEYPNCLLTMPTRIMKFDFKQCVPESCISSRGCLSMNIDDSTCHGVALWMEYDLDETNIITTGLQPISSRGQFINVNLKKPDWSMHYKQAVFFLRKPAFLCDFTNSEAFLHYDLTFVPQSGEVKMKFDVKST